MKRSSHVAIAAVTILLVSIAALRWTLPLFAYSLHLLLDALRHHAFFLALLEDCALRGFLVALSVWGMITSIGLLLTRPRARGSAVAFSLVALIVVTGSALLTALLGLAEGKLGRFEFLVGALFPIWWLRLFTRPAVKQQFRSRAPEENAAPSPGTANP